MQTLRDEEAISYILQKMSNCLDNNQMIRLEKTLEEALRGEDIVNLNMCYQEDDIYDILFGNYNLCFGFTCDPEHAGI
jgi:hypothetical protein